METLNGQAAETKFYQPPVHPGIHEPLFRYRQRKSRRRQRYRDYSNGYALYAFDLSPDLAEEGHFNLAKQGTVRVELKFGTALPNTYAEFENVIEIDPNRNIVYDFGS